MRTPSGPSGQGSSSHQTSETPIVCPSVRYFVLCVASAPPLSHVVCGPPFVHTHPSLSCFFETVVMFLLSSSSIGVNAFRKSYVISFCISLTLLVAFVLTAIFCTPEHPNIQINNLIATRYILTSMLYMSGYVYSIHNAPARHAIVRYVCFIVPVSLFKAAGRYMMASGVDAGYCVYDVGRGEEAKQERKAKEERKAKQERVATSPNSDITCYPRAAGPKRSMSGSR